MAHSIVPFLMFEGDAEEASNFYVSLFDNSEIRTIVHYGPGEAGAEGSVVRADLVIAGQKVMCIDSPTKHDFGFTPAVSLFVECDSDAELEQAYAKLKDGGAMLMPLDNYGFSTKFAWVSDRYGVSWQLNLK